MEQVYLQLASYRMSGSKLSFPEQLQATARMGYTGLELSGTDYQQFHGLADVLKELKLIVPGSHIRLEQMEQSVPLMHELDARFMIVPSLSPLDSEDDALRHAEALNKMGAKIRAEGFEFGYHNHSLEFFAPKNDPILQIMMDNTDPTLVGFEYDVGWAAASGVDCMAFLKKNADRIFLIHANESDSVVGNRNVGRASKDVPKDENGEYLYTPEEAAYQKKRKVCDCPMGKGIPDWPEIVKAAYGVKAYVVERRYSYLPDPVDSFAEDLAFMRAL